MSDGTSTSASTDDTAEAAASATLAEAWASQPTGLVASTDYSARFYAGQAATYSGNAKTASNNASKYATNANTSASSAANSASSASSAALNAESAAALIASFVAGNVSDLGDIEPTDFVAIVRAGVLYSTSYAALLKGYQSGVLLAANDLSDVPDPAGALSNLSGVPSAGVLSQLVTNSSVTNVVDVSFSFTPTVSGKLSVVAQGGSNGGSTDGLSIATGSTQNATLLTELANASGADLANYTAQYTVEAGVACNLTISQIASADSTSNNLAVLFLFLPS